MKDTKTLIYSLLSSYTRLLVGIVCSLILGNKIEAQNNLQYYIDSAIRNSPLLKENTNLMRVNKLNKSLNESQYKLHQVSLTSNYLFAPYFNNNSRIVSDITIGLNTGYKLITSPAHFETSDWIYGGIAVAATGITILVDNDIRNNFKKNHTRLLDNIADVGHNYGNAAYAIAFSGAIYLGGKIFSEEKFSTTGRMLLESLLYAGVTTTVLKTVIGRSRPYTEDGPSRFNGFQIKTETTSFPSGHSTVAFAVSSVLAERIDNVYASVLLYSLAASTVFQRVYNDRHWASDVLLGALIGYTIGKAVVKYDIEQRMKNLSVSTYYLQDGGGITLKYNF